MSSDASLINLISRSEMQIMQSLLLIVTYNHTEIVCFRDQSRFAVKLFINHLYTYIKRANAKINFSTFYFFGLAPSDI